MYVKSIFPDARGVSAIARGYPDPLSVPLDVELVQEVLPPEDLKIL